MNRVRSQAKLKDATKRIGFLSRYKLLYQSHFLKIVSPEVFHMHLDSFFIQIFYRNYYFRNPYELCYFRLGIVGANRPGEKSERSRKDRKERKKRRKKKKDDDRRLDSNSFL